MRKNIKAISLILISASMLVIMGSCYLSSYPGVLFSKHQLTLINGTDGTVSVGGEYYVGEKVTVTVDPNTGYIFYGWEGDVDAIDGFYAESSEEHSFSMPGEDIELTAQWLTLGDEGPAGGLIFYIDEADEFDWIGLEAAPEDIEVNGNETFQWGAGSYSIFDGEAMIGATATAIGSGQANTTAIVDFIDSLYHTTTGESYYAFDWDSTGGPPMGVGMVEPESEEFTDGTDTHDLSPDNDGTVAAQECTNLVVIHNGKTYDDWFLPSQDELDYMYNNLHDEGVGGFFTGDYDLYWSSSEDSLKKAWSQRFLYYEQFSKVKHNSIRVRAARAFTYFGN